MSDVKEKYERFFKTCTKMFTKALARILESDLPYQVKLKHMHKIDEYIDIASRTKLGG